MGYLIDVFNGAIFLQTACVLHLCVPLPQAVGWTCGARPTIPARVDVASLRIGQWLPMPCASNSGASSPRWSSPITARGWWTPFSWRTRPRAGAPCSSVPCSPPVALRRLLPGYSNMAIGFSRLFGHSADDQLPCAAVHSDVASSGAVG